MSTRLTSILVAALFTLISTAAWAQATEERISSPAADTPEATVQRALAACMEGSFSAYLATVHTEHKETAPQRAQRQRYEWARFSKQCRWYLVAETPVTFVITRRDPDGQNYYRLFVKDQNNANRMPVPVRLKRESAGGWGIVTNSL